MCRRADAGEAWCGRARATACALEPVEPLIAAMSAKARLISGRLLPAAQIFVPPTEEHAGHS